MLIDASALTAIFASEDDAEHLLRLLEKARVRAILPLGIWESALALARIFARPIGGVTADLELFFERLDIRILPVTAETTRLAVIAHERYGKGRHAAKLNFGDCFAYAAAREHCLPLLYKGDDFALTDIEAA